MVRYSFVIIAVLSLLAVAHQPTIANSTDSLWNVWNNKQLADTARVKAMLNIIYGLGFNYPDSSFALANMALEVSQRSGHKNYTSEVYHQLGLAKYIKRELKNVLKYYNESMRLCQETNNIRGQKSLHNHLGILHHDQGNYLLSIEHLLKGLAISKKLDDERDLGKMYVNLANTYVQVEEYDEAVKYYELAGDRYRRLNDTVYLAAVRMGQGLALLMKGDNEAAISKFETARQLYKEMNNTIGLANTDVNMGLACKRIGNYDEARKRYELALEVYRDSENSQSLAAVYENMGDLAAAMGNYPEAIGLCSKALKMGQEGGFMDVVKNSHKCLSLSYDKMGNYKQSLMHYKYFIETRDSMLNEENTRMMTRVAMQYEFDRQNEQDSIQRIHDDMVKEIQHEQEVDRQRAVAWAGIGGFAVMLGLAFVLFRSYRQKKKDNETITHQKELVEEKNNDITASINYAQRIQEAMLSAKEVKYELFPEAFVLYKPRDVVSGDFYWFGEQGDRNLIAAADCTGHGVPGAFMSMIGTAFLNEVIFENGIVQPAEILNRLKERIIGSLKQQEGTQTRDGMDVALLSFSKDGSFVEFAGANNPLWIIRDGELIVVKGDKQPIGYVDGKGTPFTNHRMDLQSNDAVYIFSDGFVDQFGGIKQKKYRSRQLKQFLLSIHNKPMLQQEQLLLEELENWQGDIEQVDDICIIGVRA